MNFQIQPLCEPKPNPKKGNANREIKIKTWLNLLLHNSENLDVETAKGHRARGITKKKEEGKL